MTYKIYLDNSATTRVDERVAKKVGEFFLENYGNPSSQHELGRRVKKEIQKARVKIADFIGAEASEIVKASWAKVQNKAKVNAGKLANDKVGEIVVRSEQLQVKLQRMVGQLEEKGYDVSGVEELVSEFETAVDNARQSHEQARTNYEAGNADEAKQAMTQAHERLKER